MQNPNPQQLPPSAELKTLRCGSSLCWMVAMVAMACIGLICLILNVTHVFASSAKSWS